MAFKQVMSLIGGSVEVAPPKDVTNYPMTADTAAVLGTAYRFNSGRLILASTHKNAAVIALESADGAADSGDVAQVNIRCAWIVPGAVFKTKITDKDGTDLGTLQAGVKVGATLNINDTGDGVDGETDLTSTNGPLTVIKLDTTNEIAWVVFNSCAVALDISS